MFQKIPHLKKGSAILVINIYKNNMCTDILLEIMARYGCETADNNTMLSGYELLNMLKKAFEKGRLSECHRIWDQCQKAIGATDHMGMIGKGDLKHIIYNVIG